MKAALKEFHFRLNHKNVGIFLPILITPLSFIYPLLMKADRVEIWENLPSPNSLHLHKKRKIGIRGHESVGVLLD